MVPLGIERKVTTVPVAPNQEHCHHLDDPHSDQGWQMGFVAGTVPHQAWVAHEQRYIGYVLESRQQDVHFQAAGSLIDA
jgi:hypothetical protein